MTERHIKSGKREKRGTLNHKRTAIKKIMWRKRQAQVWLKNNPQRATADIKQ